MGPGGFRSSSTLPFIIVVSGYTTTSTHAAMYGRSGRTSVVIVEAADRLHDRAREVFDERFTAALSYRPTRPRKGAYVALLPALTVRPEQVQPRRSSAEPRRNECEQLALMVRRVTGIRAKSIELGMSPSLIAAL